MLLFTMSLKSVCKTIFFENTLWYGWERAAGGSNSDASDKDHYFVLF